MKIPLRDSSAILWDSFFALIFGCEIRQTAEEHFGKMSVSLICSDTEMIRLWQSITQD